MRIVLDILHPAHVHVFRNFVREMEGRGHEFRITARRKECALDLLRAHGLPHTVISGQRAGMGGLAIELLARSLRFAKHVLRFRPHVLAGIMGPTIAPVGRLLRIPSAVFYDTEFARATNRFVYPMATYVVTPACYADPVNGRHVTYPGYHELAYLHPNRFTPDPAEAAAFGIDPEKPYYLLRFVSWKASHDRGEDALGDGEKRSLARILSDRGPVLISAEGPLPSDLEPLRIRGPLEKIHHLLAYAQILIGESATMASECAVLGTPAVYIAKTGRGYTDEEERDYGLVSNFKTAEFDRALVRIRALLATDLAALGARGRARLLADKIDVTAWMVEFFESHFGGGREGVCAGSAVRRASAASTC